MFDPSSIIVGLEIGTSKVCAVVGELNAENALNVVGLGQARSRGVRKGEIADAPMAEEDVRHAIVEAEQMADVEIRSVYLGVTGGHLRGFNNRGVHPVVSADREISEEDVQDVIKNAKTINLPAQNHVIHAIRQHFLVDGQDGITNPVGMLGARVEVIRPDAPTLWRRARSDGSYASANDPRVLVGLGDVTGKPTVRVHWPDGTREEWPDVAIDTWTVLTQGEGSTR